MHAGRIVFSQLLDFLPKKQFDGCVRLYQGNHRIKTFSCFDQYPCIAFAQITYRQSLRDLSSSNAAETLPLRNTRECFTKHFSKRKRASRLENLRRLRPCIDKQNSKALLQRRLRCQLKRATYALDSTTIDFCLSLFPCGKFRKHKAAVKVHTLMDLRGSDSTEINPI